MTAVALPEPAMPQARTTGLIDPSGGRVYLHAGQFTVSATPCTMTTILGSCVGVCLYDPVAHIGGLNHFLLPRAPAGDSSARYGDNAVQRLIEEVCRLGARLERLQARVAGGACVLDAYRGREGHIGRQNVLLAYEYLYVAGIPVLSADVEGDRGRRVIFYPHTGDALVRSL